MIIAQINFATLGLYGLALAAGFLGGYLLRSGQVSKARKRIFELESEMIDSHAEILKLQQMISHPPAAAEQQVPVISLTAVNDSQQPSKTRANG